MMRELLKRRISLDTAVVTLERALSRRPQTTHHRRQRQASVATSTATPNLRPNSRSRGRGEATLPPQTCQPRPDVRPAEEQTNRQESKVRKEGSKGDRKGRQKDKKRRQ